MLSQFSFKKQLLSLVPIFSHIVYKTESETGSGMENKISSARIAVQSWSISRGQASQLNKQVEAVMDAITAEPEISSCSRDTSYNFPDLTRKKPRYQAIFTVVYYLN